MYGPPPECKKNSIEREAVCENVIRPLAGNPYLRKMFIHGARAVVLRAKREGSYLGQWMTSLEGRAARNVVIVATANKLARISWAVLSSGENDHPMPAVAVAS